MSTTTSKHGSQAWFISFFEKKIGSRVIATSKAEVSINEQLVEESHKPVTKKFHRRKVYARFKDNIWAADLAEIE